MAWFVVFGVVAEQNVVMWQVHARSRTVIECGLGPGHTCAILHGQRDVCAPPTDSSSSWRALWSCPQRAIVDVAGPRRIPSGRFSTHRIVLPHQATRGCRAGAAAVIRAHSAEGRVRELAAGLVVDRFGERWIEARRRELRRGAVGIAEGEPPPIIERQLFARRGGQCRC